MPRLEEVKPLSIPILCTSSKAGTTAVYYHRTRQFSVINAVDTYSIKDAASKCGCYYAELLCNDGDFVGVPSGKATREMLVFGGPLQDCSDSNSLDVLEVQGGATEASLQQDALLVRVNGENWLIDLVGATFAVTSVHVFCTTHPAADLRVGSNLYRERNVKSKHNHDNDQEYSKEEVAPDVQTTGG